MHDHELLAATREAGLLAGYSRATISTYLGHVRRLCAWAPGHAAELDGARVRAFLVEQRTTRKVSAWSHRICVSALRFASASSRAIAVLVQSLMPSSVAGRAQPTVPAGEAPPAPSRCSSDACDCSCCSWNSNRDRSPR